MVVTTGFTVACYSNSRLDRIMIISLCYKYSELSGQLEVCVNFEARQPSQQLHPPQSHGGRRGQGQLTHQASTLVREGEREGGFLLTHQASTLVREGGRERGGGGGGGGGVTLTHTPSQCTGEKGRGEGK